MERYRPTTRTSTNAENCKPVIDANAKNAAFGKCLDQKVITGRQQSTGSSVYVLYSGAPRAVRLYNAVCCIAIVP